MTSKCFFTGLRADFPQVEMILFPGKILPTKTARG
jgi:hypothetical protein